MRTRERNDRFFNRKQNDTFIRTVSIRSRVFAYYVIIQPVRLPMSSIGLCAAILSLHRIVFFSFRCFRRYLCSVAIAICSSNTLTIRVNHESFRLSVPESLQFYSRRNNHEQIYIKISYTSIVSVTY